MFQERITLRLSLKNEQDWFGSKMTLSVELSLKQRVLNAGMWSLAGFALSLVMRLGSNLLMTRLLAPEMFGVMAIASTVMFGLAMFSDVGLRQNIVQSKRGDEVDFLNTAWSIQIVRGILIWCVALCICIAIALARHLGKIPVDSVYAAPSLSYVVAVLSITAVFQGFESTKQFEASREISLSRITGLEILTQLFGLVGMLAWVFVDRSIWALVFGALCAAFARAVLSHKLLPGVGNRWHWEKEAEHEIIHFGKWILVASVLGFLVNSGDRLLLGGLVDASTLGYYSIASLFVGSIDGVLTKLMGDVSFPAFSEIVRNRAENLRVTYYKFLAVIASIAYFASGSLMTFGGTLIARLYDARYADAGWLLQLLAAVLITIPFRLATQSFLALGMPKLQSKVVILRVIVLFLATPAGFYFFGLKGAVWGIVLSHFCVIPMIALYNIRYGLFDLRNELYLLLFLPFGAGVGKITSLAFSYWK
jgi:O-antigen/teichoic acid export membrane protein